MRLLVAGSVDFKKLNDLLYISLLVFLSGLFSLGEYYAIKLYYIPSVVFLLSAIANHKSLFSVISCRIFLLLFTFIAYLIVNSAFVSVINLSDIKYAIRIIAFVMMLALTLTSVSRVENVFTCIILFTVLGSVPDVYAYYSSGGFATHANFGVSTKFHWHTLAGGVYSLVSLLSLHKAFNGLNRFAVILYSVIFLYLCFLVFLSQSRGAILSLFISVAVFVVISVKSKRFVVVVIAGIISLLFVIYNLYGYSLTSLVQRRDAGRFDIWSEYLAKVAESPMFGYGLYPDFTVYWQGMLIENSHNLFLEALVAGGVFGFFILLCLFFTSMRTLLKNEISKQSKTVISTITCICILSLFDAKGVVENVGVVWILLWLPFGFALSLEHSGRLNR